MSQLDAVLKILAHSIGIKNIILNDAGRASIQIDQNVLIDIFTIDDKNIELSSPLDRFDLLNESLLIKMLEFNYLGSGCGPGRLALNPFERSLALCERLCHAEASPDNHQSRIEAFLKRVHYWHSDTAVSLYGGAVDDSKASLMSTTDLIFKV